MIWHTLQEQQPGKFRRVLIQYVDGYGNFSDYDVAAYRQLPNGSFALETLGNWINHSKVKRWALISDIDSKLWHTTDEKPAEGEFVLAEVYRFICEHPTETRYIVLQRRQLSCAKFTGVGYVRYNLYHEDERIVRWCYLKDLIQ